VARRTLLKALGGGVVAAPLLGTTGCGSAAAAPNTLRVSYQQWGSARIHGAYLTRAAESFALRHPDVTVELVPTPPGRRLHRGRQGEGLAATPLTHP
jgi:multiple sugar transport system substrate-binding protein